MTRGTKRKITTPTKSTDNPTRRSRHQPHCHPHDDISADGSRGEEAADVDVNDEIGPDVDVDVDVNCKEVHHNDDSSRNALSLCHEARRRWLSATTVNDLDDVEHLYRQALNAKRIIPTDTTSKRKQKHRHHHHGDVPIAALSLSEYRKAGERLSLLYLQSGRPHLARKGLEYLGFTCRLAERVLNYPFPPVKNSPTAIVVSKIKGGHAHGGTNGRKSKPIAHHPPCIILDDFLTATEFRHLQQTLADPSASYWTDHKYQVEPPSPYFSYVLELTDNDDCDGGGINDNGYGFIGHIARKIWNCPILRAQFPQLKQQQQRRGRRVFVEVWAHNRPHASGHQLHFDSDDEGRGGTIRNPMVSTVLYLNGNDDDDNDNATAASAVGGPSLITNQRLDSTKLATRGWLAHGKPRRMVAFDGTVLHGVVPGKGVATVDGADLETTSNGDSSNTRRRYPNRRVTLMMAFWKDIQIRPGTMPGSARPWPKNHHHHRNNNDDVPDDRPSSLPTWASELTRTDIIDQNKGNHHNVMNYSYREVEPIVLSHVYEHLDGRPWKDDGPMPDYEQVFQGF